MPEIYMTHPEHGATCVFDLGEVERLKGYGWALKAEAKPEATLEAELEPKLEAKPEKKKPGRKPKG